MRPTRLVSSFAIAAVFVALAGAPASAAAPTVSATPNKKLADGQQISVSARGFAPDTSMAIVECPTATVSPTDCDINTVSFTVTDDSGAYSDAPFTVSRILSDGTDCALNGGCYIGTQDEAGAGPTAATLIKFDPKIPPLPPLTLAVRVNKTDGVNAKGVVAVSGTLRCGGRGADVDVQVDLRQVVNRAIFESFGDTEVTCSADSRVPFHMTIRPTNGLFGPGAASVRLFAQAGNTFASHKVGVTLQSH
jgi:hypothetical protein